MWEEIKGLLGIAKAAETAKKVFNSPSRQVRGMIDADKAARNEGYIIQWKSGNIDAITREAVSDMSSDNLQENTEKLRNLHPDWAVHVREAAEKTSEPYMRSLWAKILAGEAEHPGSFSKNTVDVVSKLSQKDAQMFTDFCQFVWTNNEGRATPLVYDWHHPIYQSPDHFFDTVKQLTHLRLLFLDSVAGYINVFEGSSVCWAYQDISVRLNLPSGDSVKYKDSLCPMNLGHVTLTEAGEQLCSICGAKTNNSFFLYILEKWKEWGYNPSVVQEKGRE